MITSKDLRSIDRVYFDVIEVTPFYLVLRSKNTGHFWHLLEQDYRCFRSFKVFHKHHETDNYHPQTCKGSIGACCLYIKGHDAFHLKRTRWKKNRRWARTKR